MMEHGEIVKRMMSGGVRGEGNSMLGPCEVPRRFGRGAVVCHGPPSKREDRVGLLQVCTESVVDRWRMRVTGCWIPDGKRVGWVAHRCDPRCWSGASFTSPTWFGVRFFLVSVSSECGCYEAVRFVFVPGAREGAGRMTSL